MSNAWRKVVISEHADLRKKNRKAEMFLLCR